MLALAVITALFGTHQASFPTAADEGDITVPMWRMFAMGAATLPVLALDSQLADLEAVATGVFRRWQRRYLGGITLACAVLYVGISAITVRPYFLAIIVRSWLGWAGLALLVGAWLGWRLAWTGPALAAMILWYWGPAGDGRYAWWEFSARPPDDLPAFLLSAGLLATGLVVYSATPWRRRRLVFWRSRGRPVIGGAASGD